MALPIMAIAGMATKLLPMLMQGGDISRTNMGNKDSYFQQLMSMMNPNYKASSRRGQTVSGSGDSGGLLNLVSLLGGKENIGSKYSSGYDTGYNSEFYQPENWGTW